MVHHCKAVILRPHIVASRGGISCGSKCTFRFYETVGIEDFSKRRRRAGLKVDRFSNSIFSKHDTEHLERWTADRFYRTAIGNTSANPYGSTWLGELSWKTRFEMRTICFLFATVSPKSDVNLRNKYPPPRGHRGVEAGEPNERGASSFFLNFEQGFPDLYSSDIPHVSPQINNSFIKIFQKTYIYTNHHSSAAPSSIWSCLSSRTRTRMGRILLAKASLRPTFFARDIGLCL
jgi:hypothetical protein